MITKTVDANGNNVFTIPGYLDTVVSVIGRDAPDGKLIGQSAMPMPMNVDNMLSHLAQLVHFVAQESGQKPWQILAKIEKPLRDKQVTSLFKGSF